MSDTRLRRRGGGRRGPPPPSTPSAPARSTRGPFPSGRWTPTLVAGGLAAIGLGTLGPLAPHAPARARPVETGTFVEIPYGVSPAHPAPAVAGGARRSGGTTRLGPLDAPRVRWTVELPRRVLGAPILASWGVLYLPHGQEITAVDREGARLWSIPVGPLRTLPALTPGRGLVISPVGGALAWVDAFGGGVQHRADGGLGGRVDPAVLPDGSVVVVTPQHRLERFDADGERRFSVPLPSPAAGWVAVGDGPRIVVAAGDQLVLVDLDGRRQAVVDLPGNAIAGPAIGPDGTMFVATQEGVLCAYGPDGRLRHQRALEATPSSPPIVDGDGVVRIVEDDRVLVALGPTLIPRWRLAHEPLYHPIVDGRGTTYAIGPFGGLVAIDAAGRLLFHLARGVAPVRRGGGLGGPVIDDDGTIYVAAGRRVEAWRP